ncbi:carbamoyltransferase N-terminal domain-containing protein [Micromonospora sp. BRA006-A]|nr:carbamoyltransferase N-terminal domain-containing protein [Micromonospora sp. BRA006-A]
MTELAESMLPIGITGAFLWSHQARRRLAPLGLSDAAILASFQEFLFGLLLRGLRTGPGAAYVRAGEPLCLSGGCALNIKWNSGLRASGDFATCGCRRSRTTPARPSAPPARSCSAAPAAPRCAGRCSTARTSSTRRSRPAGPAARAASPNSPSCCTAPASRSWWSTAGPSWARAPWATAASSPRRTTRR